MKNYFEMTTEELEEMKRRYTVTISYFTEQLKEDEYMLDINRKSDDLKYAVKQEKRYINEAKEEIEKINLRIQELNKI